MNYYARHIGDYLKDTAHLSLLEHGVYARLLDVYYTRECGLEPTEVARLLGARSKDEKAALARVLEEFFVVEGGIYIQGRCDKEIVEFHDKQRKAKASADARWSHTKRNANAMRTHSEGNAPNNQEPIAKRKNPPTPLAGGAFPGFGKFWNAYPSNDRKVAKRQCYEKWQRRSLESLSETIVSAVEAMKRSARWQEENGRYIPAPLVYLNQDRWEAEPAPPSPAPSPRYVHPTLTPEERERSNTARIAMLAARKGIAA